MAKLSINEDSLNAIGDALRVHFGENIKEGIDTQEPAPLSLHVIYDTFGTSADRNGSYLKPEEYIWTCQVKGAARLEFEISYRTEPTDFMWVAEGAHKCVTPNAGHELRFSKYLGSYCPHCGGENIKGTGITRPVGYFDDENALGSFTQIYIGELHVCQDCGALGYQYSYIGGMEIYKNVGDLQGYKAIFPNRGDLLRTIEKFTFEGDTFTFACYTYEKTYITGYNAYLRAYDAEGQELTTLDLHEGRIPNDYSPAEMVTAIGKLNNYPNAKEVGF